MCFVGKRRNENRRFAKANGGETVQSAEVFNVQGKMVRTLAINPGSSHIVWDGRSNNGRIVNTGRYVVMLRGQNVESAADLLVSR
jgi:flagellar hook assembly protein FlgD